MQIILTKRRPDLQVLRGVSVLCVVLFHTKPEVFPNGYLGVDVFFVISGYVLAPKIIDIFSNRNSNLSGVKDFIESRYRRLMPALLFMIMVVSPLIFLLGPIDDHFKFFMQSAAAILGVANLSAASLSGDYFSKNPNPLLHTWSLSAEEQMFVLLPFCLFLIAKWTFLSIQKIRLFLFLIVLLSGTLYFKSPDWASGSLTRFFPTLSDFNYYSPFSRMWQFVTGVLLFTLISKKQLPKSIASKITGNLLLIVLLLFMSSQIILDPRLKGLLGVSLALLIIFFGTNNDRSKFPYFLLSWVGDRSYSIYLFHFPLIYLARFSPIFGDQTQTKRIPLIFSLILTFILSEICFRYVERVLQGAHRDPPNFEPKLKTYGVYIIASTLVSTLVFAFSASNNYWGINSTIPRPAVAWELNPECPPMSKRSTPCFYGASGRPKTLLIGDSQAAQISQVYLESAKYKGFNPGVWTLATCEFNLSSGKGIGEDPDCQKHNRRVFSWILNNKPELVMVAQYIKPESDLEGLAESILKLSRAEISTVLVENIPIFPDQDLFMKNTTQLQLFLGRNYTPPKTFLRSEMLLGFASASNTVSKLVLTSGVQTIRLADIFCNVTECARFAAGNWLYWDNHHLSVYGADLLKDRLVKTFSLLEKSLS